MATIFISYRHVEPDATLALQLRDALRADHRVCIDTDIPPGRQWGEVIDAELPRADVVIAIISAEAAASPMVVTEIAEAHRLNVERGRPVIMPLRVGGEFRLRYPLSAYVSRFQHVTWDDPRQTDALIARVQSALEVPDQPRRVASQRLSMIQRVRGDWIAGVLEKSLYKVARIELGLELDAERVTRGLDLLVQRPLERERHLPAGTTVLQVFDDHRGQLLILGQPGGGKTTLLLELARDLLDRAERDEQHPIPVVFNLSSWAHDRPPLDTWMMEELHLRSDVPRKLARDWVDREQILPLLDGLDEVAAEHRAHCVSAINDYRREHGWVSTVVCSRTAEYEALSEMLALPAAVVIQPLRRQQIEEYLARDGEAFASVRAALDASPEMWDLLEVPLMVSIVALAYRHGGDAPAGLGEEQLLAHYVDAMFRRRAREHRFEETQIRAWLQWLARHQVDRAQTVFFLEDVVPEWLMSGRAAAVANAVMIGISTVGASLWLYALLMTGSWIHNESNDGWGWVALFSAPVALVLGILNGRHSGPVDALRVTFPGWRPLLGSATRGAAMGAALGAVLGYGGCYAMSFREYAGETAQAYAIIGGIVLATVFAVGTMVTARLVAQRAAPGALVKRSARSALLTLAVATAVWAPFAGSGNLGSDRGVVAYLAGIAPIALQFLGWAGVFLALDRGGYFLIRHYLARAVLSLTRRGPWRYTRFLDVAADRLLMRKVGGGYIFMHRRLMEHLARSPRQA